MKDIKNTQKGFSIVISMGFTIILGLVSILILDFVIPFNKNVKGVENSSVAYYNAFAGLEESLYDLNKNPVGFSTSTTFGSSSTGTQYNVSSLSSIIPPAGEGNSEFSSDWNRYDSNIPIQLELGTGLIDFGQTIFRFRVPDLNRDSDNTNDGSLPSSSDPIINWILSGTDGTSPNVLNSNDFITNNDIDGGVINIGSLLGTTTSGNTCSIEQFYEKTGPCSSDGIDSNFTLKLSIIDTLELSDGRIIPYLEYQINFKDSSNNDISIPGRYSLIKTDGKAYRFKKSLDIKVPQTSTNQAFDFAVFQ